MEFWHGFITLTVIHLLAAASPGPDFALVSRQALLQGRRAGLWVSLGIALGLGIHIAYSAAGLATLIAHSTMWMSAIKLIGGSYLLYLGYQGIRAKAQSGVITNEPAVIMDVAAHRLVGKGFLCNALNPKAPIYFLSLFTIVLSPNLPASTLVVYGVWIMLLQLFWFSLITLFFSQPTIRRRFLAISHWIDRVFGVAMVGLGLKVLLSKN
ncbi:LysE family transporter [uncultured Tolumonas sp.]|jgi:RhtB (resistance to homoserine/threonine) family protein|uniref:LysE family translocator n=1 Tax=uncultured Tolumonas sp. TaxID=263765 RepID=UPI002930F551|nr:LysE family transporter [uncultured Tolumonas sp.]